MRIKLSGEGIRVDLNDWAFSGLTLEEYIAKLKEDISDND